MKRTKIVCTLGPACDTPQTIENLIEAGLDVARLNFSHGTPQEHEKRLDEVRRAANKFGKIIGVLLDTKGPEVRLGKIVPSKMFLEEGEEVRITAQKPCGTGKCLPVNYPGIVSDVSAGDEILLDDGLIGLEVISTGKEEVICRVKNSGEISSHKGVNVPGVEMKLPSLTEKDEEDILWGIAKGVDFIAVSFVRTAEDILAVRRLLESKCSNIKIIAKIENRAGLNNLDAILKVSDGIMIARGDLGVELPAEEVPLVQKQIISLCNDAGKPVITATQMLETMTYNPRPTRAEASDVANAIFDGTDAVMLSGETAVGKYPVRSVQTMAAIALKVEEALNYEMIVDKKPAVLQPSTTDAISYATCSIALDLQAAAIITSTASGSTARMVSKYRPRAQIIAASPSSIVLRQLCLVWGVRPLPIPETTGTDEMVIAAVKAGLEAQYIQLGDLVVVTAGVPVGVPGTTNLLKVHIVGEILARGVGVGQDAVTGRARIVKDAGRALELIEEGDIIVTTMTDRNYMPAIKKAAALITEKGGLTSHAAVVGLNLEIPVVVGVEGITSKIIDGATITVDPKRGVIYRGETKVF